MNKAGKKRRLPQLKLSRLPKIELHLHLDCSLSFEVVAALSPTVSRQDYQSTFVGPEKSANLGELLGCIKPSLELMQTEDALRLVTDDVVRQLKADNIIYAEIRFGPLLHTDGGLTPAKIVQIVDDALSNASDRTGVQTRLILCTLRHYSEEQSLEIARLVADFRGSNVVALDLAADEAGFPITSHVKAFEFAGANHLPRIAHAGEAKGPESVWETLEHLKPLRIGHGVRSSDDPKLMEALKQRKVHLEVCPSCNVQSGIYAAHRDHPIDRFYTSGLSVGINTDRRTLCNVTLTQEYERLAASFGWDKEHFLRCNINAARAAFLMDPDKERLEARLLAEYSTH